jgi:ribonuclease G
MSNNNNFSRRRRGMRFKPKGGLNPAHQKHDREAVEARADVVSEQGGSDRLFEKRHQIEIERAENVAAGLPPEGKTEAATSHAGHAHPHEHKHEAAPAAPAAEETFAPVKIPEQPKGLIETITTAASNIVKKVQRLIRPEKKVHKEVIINAETLETRVAVTEDGKLEEFNIERTTEERLVGSIFKGRVRNLESRVRGHRL